MVVVQRCRVQCAAFASRSLTGQVPQFVLEDCIARGEGGACNVVVTQPRRLAAIAVAERVAAERGEAVGGTAGYAIRLDAKRGPQTRLLFCTTGLLLRRVRAAWCIRVLCLTGPLLAFNNV